MLRWWLSLSILATIITDFTEAQLSFPPITSQDGAAATTSSSPGAAQTDDSSPTATDSSGYPIATVPPTSLAPYMQKSNLPENFVFIVAGSIIAIFFVALVLWRVFVAWKIKRSAERAYQFGIKRGGLGKLSKLTGMGAGLGHEREGFLRKPKLPYYNQGLGSEISLEPLKGKNYQEQNRSSLFFSPTTGIGAPGTSPTASNRTTMYLPAGYYPSGKSVAGTPVTAAGRPISMVDMTNRSSQPLPLNIPKTRRDSQDPSLLPRPRSDLLSESTMGAISTTSLDTRAPSTYLEEMFDADPNGFVPHDSRRH